MDSDYQHKEYIDNNFKIPNTLEELTQEIESSIPNLQKILIQGKSQKNSFRP